MNGRYGELTKVIELAPGDEVHGLGVYERIAEDQATAGPTLCAAFGTPIDNIRDLRIYPGARTCLLLFIASGVESKFNSV